MSRRLLALATLAVLGLTACGGEETGSPTSAPVTTTASAPADGDATEPTTEPTTDETAGGDGDGDDPSADLRAAAATTAETTSARVTMTSTMPGVGETTLEGVMQWGGDFAADWTMTMETGGQTIEMRQLMLPDAVYMDMGAALGTELPQRWIKMSYDDMGASTGVDLEQVMQQSQQANPASQMELLVESGDFERVGTETVDGVEATHYRGTMDVADMNEMSGGGEDALAAMRAQGVSTVDWEIWVDGDGLPVRIVQSMTSSAGEIATDIRYSDWGVEVDVTPPPASEVMDWSDLANMGG